MTRQLLLTGLAFAFFGISKMVFNVVAIRGLKPEIVGDINALLALDTLLVVLLAQPIASMIQRHAPEYLAQNRRDLARRLFSGGLVMTLALSAAVLWGLLAAADRVIEVVPLVDRSIYAPAVLYFAGYGLYFFFKMAYFGFQRVADYCLAECLASSVFLGLVAYAWTQRTAHSFIWPWLAHALVFSLVALWHLRAEIRWPAVGSETAARTRRHLTYAAYWLVTTAAGLGIYHLSILFAKQLRVLPASVGYYSVSLALLTPLTFLPVTISMVLFPAMTTNFALGTNLRNAELIRRFTLALAVALGPAVVLVLGAAPDILAWANIPASADGVLTFQLLTLGVATTVLSMPAGSFLNATGHARTSALIGTGSAALAVTAWLLVGSRAGVTGIAAGYALAMVTRGTANAMTSNRYCNWLNRRTRRLWLLPFFALAGCLAGLEIHARSARAAVVGVIMLVCVAALARPAFRGSTRCDEEEPLR